MAVNFGLLSGIKYPQGGVIATGTSSNSSSVDSGPGIASDIGEGLKGLAQGLQQGRENRRADALLKIQQNQDARNAAAFPIQQEQAKANLEQTKWQNRDLQQKREDLANERAAAAKGLAEWRMYKSKTDPVGLANYDKLSADYQNTLQETVGKMEDNKSKALKTMNEFNITGANAAMNAYQQGRNWDERNAIYQMSMSSLPTEVRKIYPPTLNENSHVMLVTAGQAAATQMKQDAIDKEATPDIKNASELAKLENKVKNGTATDEEKDKLENLKKLTEKPQGIVDSIKSTVGDAVGTLVKGVVSPQPTTSTTTPTDSSTQVSNPFEDELKRRQDSK